MSQSRKKDIADFFRPLAKTIPRKRSNPDGSDDRSSSGSLRSTPSTPNADRRADILRSPTHSAVTPRSGRSTAIPIRSPSSLTPPALRTVRKLSSLEELSPVEGSPTKPSVVQSFSDIPSSNRTVFEDGRKVAVRDSDDSDDSLQSLSELIGRKKNGCSTIGSSHQESSDSYEREGRQLLNLFTSGRSEAQRSKAKLKELQDREQANKIDLSFIYADERREAEARERIAKLKAEEHESVEQALSSKSAFAKEDLAALKGFDDDAETANGGLDRLLQAVNRTEAFSTHKTYAFFSNRAFDCSGRKMPKFPPASIPGNLFKPDDGSICNRMFLSGFMSDLAHSGHLGDDAIRWTFYMVNREQREEMAEAYLGCIAVASLRWTRTNITPADVQSIFEHLGVHVDVLNDKIEATYAARSEPQHLQIQFLVNTLKLFSLISKDLDFASLSKLCSIVCRLLVDEETMSDYGVSEEAHQLIQNLLDLPDQNSRQHIHDRILADMCSNLADPILQAVLIQNLASTTTPSLQLRADLAIKFLRDRETSLIPSTGTENRLSTVLSYLSSSTDFSIRSVSSLGSASFYTMLRALTVILDAAIGDGDPPHTFLDRNEERLFNVDVDEITRHLEELYASIPDSGASHMTRTEAKNALLDLQHRLSSAVRTRRKPQRHAFDVDGIIIDGTKGSKKLRISDVCEVEEMSKKRNFMARYLQKQTKPGQSIIYREPSTDEAVYVST